jgi:ectoine hydroxylase-related dioxygenase (phytanoyl-CoA dioxygenase family)
MNIKNICKNFKKNGFVVIPKFLSKAEIKIIFSQLNELIDVPIKSIKPSLKKKLTLDKKYLFLHKNNPRLKSHFYETITFIDSINKISISKKITNIVKKILNEKTIFVGSSQIRIDHTNDPYYLPQHQELGQMSTKLVLFYMPLVDLNKKTGGLFIRPKTHELGFVPYKGYDKEAKAAGHGRQKIIDKLFTKPNLSKYKSRYIKLNAGDAVIFHNYLFHGTLPNLNKKKIRWVYLVRFNSMNKTPFIKDSKSSLAIPYTADYTLL